MTAEEFVAALVKLGFNESTARAMIPEINEGDNSVGWGSHVVSMRDGRFALGEASDRGNGVFTPERDGGPAIYSSADEVRDVIYERVARDLDAKMKQYLDERYGPMAGS